MSVATTAARSALARLGLGDVYYGWYMVAA